MTLTRLDISILVGFLLLSFFIGWYFRKKASSGREGFFLGGRNLGWFMAGISMVATTFAADTPLTVTEIVASHGISGNWLWWSLLTGGMVTTFFFARLWRRSGVLTEAELIELRYSGKPARFLRGLRAVYLGGFMNLTILAWVNVAMVKIFRVYLGLDQSEAVLLTGGVLLLTGIYSSIGGFLGVVYTDFVQFVLAMTGCIILAVIVVQSPQIGGIAGLKAGLPAGALDFFPDFSNSHSTAHALTLSGFAALAGFVWWSSWYPGAEPGGGGYIAQRMLSTKNEKNAVLATLLFQIAHYGIRPWPWIITGLCSLVLYPNLPESAKAEGFVMVMRDFLGTGFTGLLLVAFLGAYMSTIATQINWGTSYIVNDFYRPFLQKKGENSSEKHYVNLSRLVTLMFAILSLVISLYIDSIKAVWEFVFECGAGLGLVLMLRWYWWRINAWSEIAATLAPFVAYAFSKFWLAVHVDAAWGLPLTRDPRGFYLTIGFTTLAWITVTLLTKPTDSQVLNRFYSIVKPGGSGWKKVAAHLNIQRQENKGLYLMLAVISSVILTYAALFASGYVILGIYPNAWWALAALAVGITGLYTAMRCGKILDSE